MDTQCQMLWGPSKNLDCFSIFTAFVILFTES